MVVGALDLGIGKNEAARFFRRSSIDSSAWRNRNGKRVDGTNATLLDLAAARGVRTIPTHVVASVERARRAHG